SLHRRRIHHSQIARGDRRVHRRRDRRSDSISRRHLLARRSGARGRVIGAGDGDAMSEIYRKFGRVVRYEHGTTIAVSEAGEAIETSDTFIATPLRAAVDLAEPELPQFRIENAERLIISRGIALHQFGDAEWREETARLHVS